MALLNIMSYKDLARKIDLPLYWDLVLKSSDYFTALARLESSVLTGEGDETEISRKTDDNYKVLEAKVLEINTILRARKEEIISLHTGKKELSELARGLINEVYIKRSRA